MTKPFARRAAALLLAVALPVALPAAALAAPVDPAAQAIDGFDAGLLAIMRAGATAGQGGRARIIAPVIDRTFDLPLMTRLSVGPDWVTMTASDQARLTAAFRAMTIAQFAHNFDSFGGERITLAPQVETRGTDKLVRTMIASPDGDNAAIAYRMREDGGPGSGRWRVIDVYYKNAISQLATHRADYAAVLARGGATALTTHLLALAANPK